MVSAQIPTSATVVVQTVSRAHYVKHVSIISTSLLCFASQSQTRKLSKSVLQAKYIFFFFQNRFFLNGGSFWYKLTPCVSPFCKLFNILTFRISDNEHCARKIVLRARNAFRTFEKRTPWVSCIKFDVGRKHYRQTLKY